MKREGIRYYQFGEFQIDTRRRILFKNGKQFAISPRIFDLLLVLVQNEGEILDHDELLDQVWEGMFVEQSNLKKSVSALRQILGEHPDERLYIKTVPRRGYSFVAPVQAIAEEPETPVLLHQTATEIIVEEEIQETEEINHLEKKVLPAAQNGRLIAGLGRYKFVLLMAGVILTAGVFGFTRFFGRASSLNYSVENVNLTRLTSTGNISGGSAVISSNGKYVVFATIEKDGQSLWVKQIATQSATQLVAPVNAQFWSFTFAPDSEFIYYVIHNIADPSRSGLYKTPLFGGTPVRIFEKANGALTISPDNKQIAFFRTLDDMQNEIVVARPDGGDEKRLALYDQSYRIWDMKWSPDNRALLCTIRHDISSKTVTSLIEIYPDGRSPHVILPEQNDKFIISAVWLPDQGSILLSARQPNSEARQVWQYFPSGNVFKRVTNDDNSYKFLSLSQDGKTLATTQEKRATSIWTTENLQESLIFNFTQTASGTTSFDRVVWTGDGRLVYSVTENGSEIIGIMAADGSKKTTLTDGKDGIWLFPTISADGKQIIFNSKRSGRGQIWRIDLEGKNLTQLTEGESESSNARLLADGQTLVYQASVPPLGWVLMMKSGDGSLKRLTDMEVGSWDVSPDEKLVAYVAQDRETKKTKTFVCPLEGGSPLKVFDIDPNRTLRWTRDGKALTFDIARGDSGEIVLQPLEGEKKTLASFAADRFFWFDWSFDGKTFACIRGKHLTDVIVINTEDNAPK